MTPLRTLMKLFLDEDSEQSVIKAFLDLPNTEEEAEQ